MKQGYFIGGYNMNNIKKSQLIEWIISDNLGVFTGEASDLEAMKKPEIIAIWEAIRESRKTAPISR